MKNNNRKQQNKGILHLFMRNHVFANFQSLIFINTKKITVLFCLLVLVSTFQQANAQTSKTTLMVVNDNDKPIEGVTINSVSNPNISSPTDAEGMAILDMEPNGQVEVFFNDIQKMVTISKNYTTIKLSMSDKRINLGYGISKPVDQITSSVDVVYSDKLEKSSLLNPTESLYGQLKGLMVLQNGGEPWARAPNLYLRGLGTTASNRILVMVDGFERDLASLSLPEIESVTVLKDGADLARYGQRGANGVILVTTKRGEYKSFHMDFTFDNGINTPFRTPEFLDAYGHARAVNQASVQDGNLPVYSNLDLQDYQNGTYPFLLPNVNWIDETLKNTGSSKNLNARFWGGGESVKYFVSLNYQNEIGFIDNTDLDNRYDSRMKYDRFNFRTNLDVDLTSTTKFILNVSGNIGGRTEPFAQVSNIFSALYSVPSSAFPVRTESGNWGGTQFYDNNPVALASSTGVRSPNFRTLFTDGRLVQDLGKWVKGLSVEAALAYDNYASFFENRQRGFLYESVTFTRDPLVGTVDNTTSTTFGTDTDLTYSDSFGDQQRQATGYGKINYETAWDSSTLYTTLMYQQDKRVNDGQYNTFLNQNIMASGSYGYKNRYFIDGVLSYSGTDVLPEGDRFGLFPAISVGWVVNRENFLKNNKSINYLKLRGSWGMSGNNIMSPNLDDQAFGTGATYYFNDNNASSGGIGEGRLPTQGLTYENSIKTNIGFNLELFGELTLSVDAFYDKRENILIESSSDIPSVIGIATPFQNAGIVKNRGIESSLMWKKEVGEFKYFIGGNFTFAKNEIVRMNEEFQPYDYLKQTGNPIGQQYGLQSLGFFENQADIDNSPNQLFSIVRPGDVKYKDQNNDGVVDALDIVPIGHSGSNPELYYAINMGYEMKGFGIDLLFQGIANQTLYLNTKSMFWPLVGQNTIGPAAAGSWTPETAGSATLPRLTLLSNDNNYQKNDIWLTSGNYLKLRRFEMYYSFPESVISKLKVTKAKLYARGMNVFSFDSIRYADPEDIGVGYPTLASYHFGINLEF